MPEETPQETPAEEIVAPASETPEQEAPPEYVSKSDYKAGLEALEKSVVDRLKQSTGAKVKAAVSSEIRESLSEFDKVVELLKPHLPEDVDIEALKEREFIRSLMAEDSPTPEVEPETPSQEKVPEVATSPPGLEDEIQSILDARKVSGDEPELKEYLEKNREKRWFEIGQGFDDLAAQIAARSAGTPAGVVPSQGQEVASDLVKQFREELAEGKKQGHKGMRYLRQLQAKYVEKGANIDDLDISSKESVQTRDYLYAKDGPR